MQRRLRKPLNVGYWGKQLAWEFAAVPHILAGLEPDDDVKSLYPSPTVNNIADAMLAAMAIGRLQAFKGPGKLYFLAPEVLDWGRSAGFQIPDGLMEAVQATAADYVRHVDAQTAIDAQKAGDAIAKARQTSRDAVKAEEPAPARADSPEEAGAAAAPIPAGESPGQVQGLPKDFKRGDALRYELLELVREARKEKAGPNAFDIMRRIRPSLEDGGVIVGLKDDGLYYLEQPGAEEPLILKKKDLLARINRLLAAQ